MKLRILSLCLALVILPLAGCTPEAQGNSQLGADTLWTGAQIKAQPNLLGLKWNWQQKDVLDQVTKVAGGATFFEFEWCTVEPTRGKRDFTTIDNFVASSRRMGYEPMLKIRVGSCWLTGTSAAPKQGRNKAKTSSRMPDDLAYYREFVSTVIQRYASRGVTKFAIENEPNAKNFWADSVSDYKLLMSNALQAVNSSGARVQLADSGLSSIAYGVIIADDLLGQGKDIQALEFYRDYYSRRFARSKFVFPDVQSVDELRAVLGGASAIRAVEFSTATIELANQYDVYQLHYYEGWDLLPTVMDYLHQRLPVGHTIEAWEMGVAWPGQDYEEVAAATETAKLYATALSSGIRRLVYLPAAYTPGTDNQDEIWRGLWLENGKPRAAAGVYRQLAQATSGADVKVGPLGAESGLKGVSLRGDSFETLVVWSGSGDKHVLGSAPPNVVVTSSEGRTLDWPASGLLISSTPVFITRQVSSKGEVTGSAQPNLGEEITDRVSA